jgi:hypothetical protein
MAGDRRADTPSIENLAGRRFDVEYCGAAERKEVRPGVKQIG